MSTILPQVVLSRAPDSLSQVDLLGISHSVEFPGEFLTLLAGQDTQSEDFW